jgi:hypothetical protein
MQKKFVVCFIVWRTTNFAVCFYVGAHSKAHMEPAQIHKITVSGRSRSDGLH